VSTVKHKDSNWFGQCYWVQHWYGRESLQI
jgi:hypothetical protein